MTSPGCSPGRPSSWHRGSRPWAPPQGPPPHLCQPVPERLDHDAAVVVALLLVGLAQLLHPEAGDGEQAQVVADARVQRGDEISEAEVRVCAGRVLLRLQIRGGGGAVSTDVHHTPRTAASSPQIKTSFEQGRLSVCAPFRPQQRNSAQTPKIFVE